MNKKDRILKMVEDVVLKANISVPRCDCKDGGIPDNEYKYMYFCKCLKCGWYIAMRDVVNKKGDI